MHLIGSVLRCSLMLHTAQYREVEEVGGVGWVEGVDEMSCTLLLLWYVSASGISLGSLIHLDDNGWTVLIKKRRSDWY